MAIKTIKASGGDYTTLTAWEAALPGTLTQVEEAECYNFDLDDTLAMSGVTTSAANYLRIYAATGARHDGRSRTVSGTGFRLKRTATGGVTFSVQANHLRLDGLEIEGVSSTTPAITYSFGTFAAGANDHRIENCIIHDVLTGAAYTVSLSVANLAITLRNNIVYGYQRSTDTRNAASCLSENNTFWRHAAQLGLVSDTELVCKNTYSGHTGAASEDFFTGAAAPSGNNNASSDTSQATDYTAGVSSVAGSAVFVSVTPGAEDFTLKAGTNALVDAGATLGSVTTDAKGTSRPQGASYDIGALERVVSGGATDTPINPDSGTLALSGYAPAVTQSAHQSISPGSGNVAISGYAPAVVQSAHQSVNPADGALTLTGCAPSITQSGAAQVSPGSGSITITGFAPGIEQTVTTADPRYARPQEDISAGVWLPSTGISLAAMLDEATADSADYISTGSPGTAEIRLHPVVDPNTSSGQVVRYQCWSADGSGLTVRLKQGAVVIAEWTHGALPVSPTVYAQTLSSVECDSITDYADLRFEFEAA